MGAEGHGEVRTHRGAVDLATACGKNAVVMAQSGVPGDLEGGKSYWGSPTVGSLEKRRELIWIRRIPEIWTVDNPKERAAALLGMDIVRIALERAGKRR